MVKFGFIGTGNMGSALARAVSRSVNSKEIMLSNRTPSKAVTLSDELSCLNGTNEEVASNAKFIFLGVKPQMMRSCLEKISSILSNRTDRFVLVPMAAGIKITEYNQMLKGDYPIIRIMPNTPCSIGKGMIVYDYSENVFMDEITEFCDALKFAGKLDKIDENLIDAACSISGCGPAFVYMFLESLADGGVECGLPRQKAIEYASQTLIGASSLVLSSGKHPGLLKDEVCSPAGTTIAGVHSLENNGFRGSVISAVKASFDKNFNLKK